MNKQKEDKTKRIIAKIEDMNHFVAVKANGHISVIGIDFWCTTEKWWHARECKRGKGLKSFIEYIEEYIERDDNNG